MPRPAVRVEQLPGDPGRHRTGGDEQPVGQGDAGTRHGRRDGEPQPGPGVPVRAGPAGAAVAETAGEPGVLAVRPGRDLVEPSVTGAVRGPLLGRRLAAGGGGKTSARSPV
ncbi:hypothetical protein [Streptomyces sp. enrichment culture]|uniref:hypothetical protein n=1 Tax=Streptomyces sp. enrichment culture TaxID=1795815 RepID=UPI003F56E3E0